MSTGLKYDPEALKKRLDEAVNGQRGNSRFRDTRYKPLDGDVIRLFKFPDGTILHDVDYHFNIGDHRVVVCPKTFGEKCAICDESFNLWKQAKLIPEEKEEEKLAVRKAARALTSVRNGIMAVRVKNRETDKKAYFIFLNTFKSPNDEKYSDKPNEVRQIMEWMINPDYGDITDSENGNDIVIKLKDMVKGKFKFQRRTLEIRPVKSPLAATDAEIEAIVSSLPDISEIVTKVTYADSVKMMQELMSAGTVGEPEIGDVQDTTVEKNSEDMPF